MPVRSTLKSITKLLLPPRTPRGLDRSWDVVEKELGLALPSDYKAFIDVYGSGQVSSAEGWVVVWNFRDAAMFGDPLRETLCGTGSLPQLYRRLATDTDYPCPHPIYPDAE